MALGAIMHLIGRLKNEFKGPGLSSFSHFYPSKIVSKMAQFYEVKVSKSDQVFSIRFDNDDVIKVDEGDIYSYIDYLLGRYGLPSRTNISFDNEGGLAGFREMAHYFGLISPGALFCYSVGAARICTIFKGKEKRHSYIYCLGKNMRVTGIEVIVFFGGEISTRFYDGGAKRDIRSLKMLQKMIKPFIDCSIEDLESLYKHGGTDIEEFAQRVKLFYKPLLVTPAILVQENEENFIMKEY